MNIKAMLDILSDYHAQRDAIALQKGEIVDRILTPEIKAQLKEIDDEFSVKTESVNTNIAELEKQIKDAVIEIGESVKGEYLHAVWSKGRVSWDTKALDGYIVAHPELEQFRKVGSPSVSIRLSK